MKILVIGSGGREDALIWKIAQSPDVEKIYCAPGNAGIAMRAEIVPLRVDDIHGLATWARDHQIDLTVVGPELPLTLGIVDLFQKEGLPIFGPSSAAAVLEGSKAWTKEFLKEYSIPTAAYEIFEDEKSAAAYIKNHSYPLVIKADGLAAGKGVFIAVNQTEALAALDQIFKRKAFGEAGKRVVIEEYLTGTEASFLAFVDGVSILPLDSSQDHKRVRDGDQGPNTGGMGAFSPSPIVTETVTQRVIDEILIPTLKGLQKLGVDYQGVLYAGLMIDAAGRPKLLEYNVRFGDPETQALMVRLESDLVDVMQATIERRLKGKKLIWKKDPSVCVVMAASGYPEKVQLGDEIQGLEKAASVAHTAVFHAGTKKENDVVKTAGGRVLGVTATGKDLRQARERAYDVCEKIYWKGIHYRKDIGLKGAL